MDDMIVKSKKALNHITHLEEMFHILCRYGMKLDLLKSSFEVSFERSLGFIVHARG